jgi:hypothetical protein
MAHLTGGLNLSMRGEGRKGLGGRVGRGGGYREGGKIKAQCTTAPVFTPPPSQHKQPP